MYSFAMWGYRFIYSQLLLLLLSVPVWAQTVGSFQALERASGNDRRLILQAAKRERGAVLLGCYGSALRPAATIAAPKSNSSKVYLLRRLLPKSKRSRSLIKRVRSSCELAPSSEVPTPTATLTPTATPTPAGTPSPMATATATATPSASATPVVVATQTPASTPTATSTPTPLVTPSSNIQLVVSASQTSGPAPLAVAFDASTTTGLAGNDYVGATFIWDFGDGDGDTWPHTGKARDAARGFISGYVYESPGSYTARVRVIDREGNQSAEHLIPINVSPAAQIYTQTFCVSNSGTDTSCAAGAVPLGSVQQVVSNLGPNKRFLFQRGFQQSISSALNFGAVAGPLYLGAYGAGAAPLITFTSSGVEAAFYMSGSDRVTIEDMHFRGPDVPHNQGAPVGFWLDSNRSLLNRVIIEGFDRNIHLPGGPGSPERVGNFIVNSLLNDSGYFSLTVSHNFRLTTVLGNLFSNSVQGHIRLLEGQKTFISQNRFQDSFAVKSHSGNTAIVDNLFAGGEYTRVAYGTGGGGELCVTANKMHHLLEANAFLGVSSYYSGGVAGATIGCGGNFVIRGNLFDRVGGAVTVDGGRLESGFTGALPIRIYNNYKSDNRDSTHASNFIRLNGPVPATEIRNNAVYYPSLNFRNGDRTTAIISNSADTSNLNIDFNMWYMPLANGNSNSTPGMFVSFGPYPNQVGYSSTAAAAQPVQYFGELRPLSSWHALGFDLSSLFLNPGALSTNAQGLFELPPSSPVFVSGDPDVPFYLDFHGRRRQASDPGSIGPFFE